METTQSHGHVCFNVHMFAQKFAEHALLHCFIHCVARKLITTTKPDLS